MKQKILIIEENVDMRKNSAELLELHHFGVITQNGLLITGQNPASSEAVASLLLKTLIGEK